MAADNKTQIVISAKDETAATFAAIKSEFLSLTQTMSGINLASGLGVTAVAAGLLTLTKSSIDYMASLHDMAIATGASVESLSAMKMAAKLANTSLDEVQGSIRKLGISLGEAKLKGGDKAELFKALGIDPRTTTDTGQALFDLAKKLDAMPDKFKAMSVARDLLGKTVSMPFLEELAQMDKLTAKVTTEQADAAHKFEQNSIKFKAGAAQLGTAIANDVLPGMNDLLKFSLEVKKEWGALAAIIVGLGGGAILKGLGIELDPLKRAATESTEAINELIKARKKLADESATRDAVSAQLGPLGQWMRDRQVDSASEGVTAARARAKAALAQEARLFAADEAETYSAYRRKKGGLDLPDAKPLMGKVPKVGGYTDYAAHINEAVAGAINNSDEVKAREFIDKIETLDKLFFDSALDADIYTSALAKLTGQTDKASKETDRLMQLLDATPTAKLEETRKDMELLAAALEGGHISENQFIEAAQARLGTLGVAVKEVDSFARDMGLSFSSAFEDAVIGGKSLSDVMQGLGKDIERIVLRKTITEPLGNSIADMIKGSGFGTGGGLLSGIKSLFGFANGGAFTVGGAGGTDSQVVAFRATPGEEVVVRTPSQQSSGGGQSIVIHQTISIDSRSDQASIVQAMVQAKNAAVAEIGNSMRRGGAFA